MDIQELIKEEGGEIVWKGEEGVLMRLIIGKAGPYAEELATNLAEPYWRSSSLVCEADFNALLAAHEEAITKKYQPLVDAARAYVEQGVNGLSYRKFKDALSTLDKEGEE